MAHIIAQDGIDGHAEGIGYVHKILYANALCASFQLADVRRGCADLLGQNLLGNVGPLS